MNSSDLALPELNNWNPVLDTQGLLWMWADTPNQSSNTLGEPCLAELEQMLVLIEESDAPLRGLVIASAKANGFFAGADIKQLKASFDSTTDPENRPKTGPDKNTHPLARSYLELGHRVFNRLENLPIPSLAMIHGYCLGGGTELSLACTYRIAADTPETRIGLPEVRIGIHPGWGGSVRLPALIGDLPALGMMLSGSPVPARKAEKLGLVDRVRPQRQLENGARAILLGDPRSARKTPSRWLCRWPLRPLAAYWLHLKTGAKAAPEQYPAPHRLIDFWAGWVRHAKPGSAAYHRGLSAEVDSVVQLSQTPTAANLLRVFDLSDRLKHPALPADIEDEAELVRERLEAIGHVHVIGAGVMGGDIAAWVALQGFRVSLQDSQAEAIGRTLKRARSLFEHKLRDPFQVQAAMDRLMPDLLTDSEKASDYVRGADVIIEAIFEDVRAKRELFQRIEPHLKPHALLCTNTSSLTLEELHPALREPERLIGLHFFNPVARMPLVEIIHAHPERFTGVQEKRHNHHRALAALFTRKLDRLPLPVLSSPGFLINRILMPYLLEAITLEAEGINPTAIDQAAVEFGMPMGPLELADTVGLDICLAVGRVLSDRLNKPVPQRLRDLVDENRLGKKSGEGFYRWPKNNGKGAKPDKPVISPVDGQVGERLILSLLNEAVACYREGLVEDEDTLDAGMIFATGFAPFRGGPLHYIHTRGVVGLKRDLKLLEEHEGPRFHPDPGWGHQVR